MQEADRERGGIRFIDQEAEVKVARAGCEGMAQPRLGRFAD